MNRTQEQIFAKCARKFGVPEKIVTDDSPGYKSAYLREFLAQFDVAVPDDKDKI
jgi:transposase-like protein